MLRPYQLPLSFFLLNQQLVKALTSDWAPQQTNDCPFVGFSNCTNFASLGSVITSGVEGKARILQDQSNDCKGSDDPADPTSCSNTAPTELFLSASDQAFIESNSRQITDQTNTCIAGASCENTGVLIGSSLQNEVIGIAAEDQAIIKANSGQETFQDNVCEGTFAECTNSGFELIGIIASDQATVNSESDQDVGLGNECRDAFCQDSGI